MSTEPADAEHRGAVVYFYAFDRAIILLTYRLACAAPAHRRPGWHSDLVPAHSHPRRGSISSGPERVLPSRGAVVRALH